MDAGPPRSDGSSTVKGKQMQKSQKQSLRNIKDIDKAEADNPSPSSGLILKSGRVRLPDKLMEFLNNEVAPEALYWMSDGETFAVDTEKVAAQVLDKFFRGTKVSSFLRSISRWGYKRVFFHNLSKHVYAFCHPLFKKAAPHLEAEMQMISSKTSSQSKLAMAKMATTNPAEERQECVAAQPPHLSSAISHSRREYAAEHCTTLSTSTGLSMQHGGAAPVPSPSMRAQLPVLQTTSGVTRRHPLLQQLSSTMGIGQRPLEADFQSLVFRTPQLHQLSNTMGLGQAQPLEAGTHSLVLPCLSLQGESNAASARLQMRQEALVLHQLQRQMQQQQQQEEHRRQAVLLELILINASTGSHETTRAN